jgi:hypothetical protein
MEQKLFAPKSQNCFCKKNPRFCFIVAKTVRSKKKKADLVGDLAGDVGAIFCTIEAS